MLTKKSTLFRDLKPGELYVTGPGEYLYAKMDETRGRDVITGRVTQPAAVRICRPAAPKDLRRSAKRLVEHRIFHPANP